jgi:hypothetical protein
MPKLGAEHELLLAIAKILTVGGAYAHLEPLVAQVEANQAHLLGTKPPAFSSGTMHFEA